MKDLTRVFNCDCLPAMREFPDKWFDLAIVDPPYGIGNWIQTGGKVSPNFEEVKWNDDGPKQDFFNELKRISKERIIWGANYYNCFEDGGAIIWHKFSNGAVNNFSECEIASYSRLKRVGYVFIPWPGGSWRTQREGIQLHPCQKPIKLYKWLLKNYAKEGDKILDTHLGSGSSRIAAFDMGFDFTGYELDKDYFEAQELRFKRHKAQLKLFEV